MMVGGEACCKVGKTVVPEGIYYILSGVKGDTMGRGESKKKKREGVKRISPGIIFTQEAAERKHSPQRGEEEETLPVSVEGARDVERVRTAFVVSSGAKSIHKAAVGKRSLHKETEQRERKTNQR